MTITDPNIVKTFHHRIYDYKKIIVEFSLHKPLVEFVVNINFSVITKDERVMPLSKINFDGCQSLKTVQNIKFLKVMFRELFRVSNLPRKCPLEVVR